jgi:uncharacterized protein with GYD domain
LGRLLLYLVAVNSSCRVVSTGPIRGPCTPGDPEAGVVDHCCGRAMPKFLFEASYTLDGVKGVQSAGGTSRRDAVGKVAESVGGQLERFDFAFGDRDAYVIVDLPDHESAAAVALTVS